METLITEQDIKDSITLNYMRLQDARNQGDSPELQELFEQRMNNSLDSYSDYCKFASRQLVETMVVGD